MINVDQLVEDLKKLRQGAGLDAPDLAKKITDPLRTVFGLDGDDATVRDRLKRELTELAEPLLHDHRHAVLIAYGLTDDTRSRTLKDRMAVLATRLDRSERSATRRIDEGVRLVVERAFARHRDIAPTDAPPVSPWRTTSLRTWVVLDRDAPEVYELRRITATSDGLAEVELELTANKPGDDVPDDPRIELLGGGQLQTRLRRSRTRIGYVLVLPRPLDKGAEHEFLLRFRFSDHTSMEPFYMCTPTFSCASFDLRVKFGIDRIPDVWRVDGLRINEVLDPTAPRTPVDPDATGDVHLTFTGLTPNVSWGAVWSTKRP